MENRSFHFKGRRFPVCARCTGELIGIIVGIIVYIIVVPDWKICCILGMPMIVDGFLQKLTVYESNNVKRVVTGVLFGCGMVCLFLISTVAVARYGVKVGNLIIG